MYKTVEATYRNGVFFSAEPVHVAPEDRILLTVIPGGKQPVAASHSLRGAFRGKLSTVSEFIAAKSDEKEVEL